MNNFSVLHITKYKNLDGIGGHIDRKHIPENADSLKAGFNESVVEGNTVNLLDVLGSTVDKSKSKLNEQMQGKGYKKLSVCVDERIAEGHVGINKRTGQVASIRKDAVKALGIILTGSHERMMQIQENEMLFDQWKRDNYDFACKMWGDKNIVRFTLHMDEKTPHFHCVVVPINSEGRLSAKSFMDGSDQLKSIQDQYAMAMSKYGLERGIPKVLSHRAHVKTRDYYQSAQTVIEQAEDLTASIKKSNFLKLDRIRDEMTVHVSGLKLGLMEQLHKVKYLDKTNQSLMENLKRNSFEREFNKNSCDYIKGEIPLIPFATDRLGWSIVKEKSTKKDVVLMHPKHGNIIAPTAPKERTGHWVYSHTQGGGGTLVDLLRLDRWGWDKINELANDYTVAHGYQHVYGQDYKHVLNRKVEAISEAKERLSADKQRDEVEKYLGGIVPTKGEGFLKNREIGKQTYRDMDGLTFSKQSAVFHLYTDLDKQGDKRICSTITYYHDRIGESKKFFQKDLPRGVSVLVEHEKKLTDVKKIFITESPVDALSYRQLFPDATRDMALVSTCGSLSMGVKRDIEQVCHIAKEQGQKVVLGFDNDVAGRKMTETIAASLKEMGMGYEIAVPQHGKDWNDHLKWVNNPSLQHDEDMTQRLTQRQKELFEESEYEKSLLPKLGIEKDTYMAFKEQLALKCNEKAMLVELKGRESGEVKVSLEAVDLAGNNGGDLAGTKGVNVSSVVDANESMGRNWTLSIKGDKLNEYLSEATSDNKQEQSFVLNGDLEKVKKVILVSSPIEAMVHYQQVVGQDKPGEDRQEIAKKHMQENCYLYCPVEDRLRAKEAVIEVLEQAYERKQKVAWIAGKEHDPLTLLMGEMEREVDQKIEKEELKQAWKELDKNVSEEMVERMDMQQGLKEIGMNVGSENIEKVAIGQDVKKIGHVVGHALDLISSLSDQDGIEDMDGVEEEDDDDKKKRRAKGRGMDISR